MAGKPAGQNFHENRAKFEKIAFQPVRTSGECDSACFRMGTGSVEQDVASHGERELKENRSLSLLVKTQKNLGTKNTPTVR